MSRVLALVEGQTEVKFVKDVLAPALERNGVNLAATMIGKPGRRGGVLKWPTTRKELAGRLKEDPGRFCTTMFDYYGLPDDWPSLAEAKSQSPGEGVELIEQSIREEIASLIGDALDPGRFIPYIQLHEFEAILFSDTSILAKTVQRPDLQGEFARILGQCGAPEEINDGRTTAPSKRIIALVSSYQKTLHGIIAAKQIGLDKIRGACPHFDQWLRRLEQLGSS